MHYEDLITDAPGAKRELFLFVLVLGMLTFINLSMLFIRQMPIIEARQYDYRSPFTFQQILDNKQMRFKACFHKDIRGGFYLCFLFPPPKSNLLAEGFLSIQSFEQSFVDPGYLKAYVAKFKETKWQSGKDLTGFEIKKIKEIYQVTPVY